MRRWIRFVFFAAAIGGGIGQVAAIAQPGARQAFSPKESADFIWYLMGRGDYDEAFFLLERTDLLTASSADTINYLRGWILYQQKALHLSSAYLLQVSPGSELYFKSQFFGAYNLAHEGNIDMARNILTSLDIVPGSLTEALRSFQLSGVSLLDRDMESSERHSREFSGRYNAFAIQEQQMLKHAGAIRSMPSRSPVVAGLLSATVPGLGKIYAGKPGEGIAAFIYTMALGATAYDFYRGAGPQSALFILSGSLAAIFYAGNIWGSAVAVNRVKMERNYEIDQRILFDMHIPLRNVFN